MVDIVVNHFGAAGDGNNVDYSKLVPFNRPEYFHSFRLLSETSPNEISPVQAQQVGDHADARGGQGHSLIDIFIVLDGRQNGTVAGPQDRGSPGSVDAELLDQRSRLDLRQCA